MIGRERTSCNGRKDDLKMWKNFFRNKRKRLTARQLRERYGSFTTMNVSMEELKEGVERQWKRYNDREFQHQEFQERLGKVFKH